MASTPLASTTESGVLVVELAGRLDSSATADFDRQMAEMAHPKIVLDLSKLEHIGSAGLRGVLAAVKRVNASGGKLALAAPNAQIESLFEISGFVTLVTIYPDRASAVAALT